MASYLSKRNTAFICQSRRCFYCGYRMWLSDPEQFAASAGLSLKQTSRLRCTAEHLLARCEGGKDGPENIVAACLSCNRRRHARRKAMAPFEYKALVLRRVNSGRWHGPAFHGAL